MTSPGTSSDGVASPPLERYAWALAAPAEDGTVPIIELDRRWGMPAAPSAEHVVAGRPPLRSVKPLPTAVANLVGRTLFPYVFRRRAREYRLVRSQRLPPPPGASGASGAARNFLLSGALFQFSTDGRFRTLFDDICKAASADEAPATYHASGDGSIVARIDVGGSSVVLRAAPKGSLSDPSHIADALEHLASHGVARVPRPLGRGEIEGISWMTESRLTGSEPPRVDAQLLEDVVAFCSQLPVRPQASTLASSELQKVAEAFPDRAASVARVSDRVVPILEGLPAATRHGDLWAGNLLVQDGRLVGVVDWAAWHEAAVPGTDLLHLWASETKRGSSRELGEIWSSRPWTDATWLQATRPYWSALGIEPDEPVLEAIAAAWWAAWVVQSLLRHPARARNNRWVAGNVDAVLESLS